MLEVGAHVVHLAVAVLASGCAAVRFLFRGYIYGNDDELSCLMNVKRYARDVRLV